MDTLKAVNIVKTKDENSSHFFFFMETVHEQ